MNVVYSATLEKTCADMLYEKSSSVAIKVCWENYDRF